MTEKGACASYFSCFCPERIQADGKSHAIIRPAVLQLQIGRQQPVSNFPNGSPLAAFGKTFTRIRRVFSFCYFTLLGNGRCRNSPINTNRGRVEFRSPSILAICRFQPLHDTNSADGLCRSKSARGSLDLQNALLTLGQRLLPFFSVL